MSKDDLRRQVEEILRQRPETTPFLPTADVLSLIRELQTHGAELESQNDALRWTQIDLAGARDLYAELHDLAPIGYVLLEQDATIRKANLTAARMLGLDRAKLIGLPFAHFIHDDGQDQWLAFRVKAFESEATKQTELTLHREDGTRLHVLLQNLRSPAAIRAGNWVPLALIDVTAYQRAQEALRESEGRFRAIFNTALDSIFIKDRDLKYTWVNPAMQRLLSRPADQLVGKSDVDLFGAEQAGQIHQVDRRVLAGETVETRHAKSIGGVAHVFHVVKVPMRDAAGEVIGLCGIARDITQLERVEEALRRAKEEWERTFNSVPDLIAILDDQHRVIRVNKAMADRLGLPPEQCVGRHCYEHVHGLGCAPSFCPHVLTLADGKEHAAELHEDRLGGDFLVSTSPLRSPDGQMIGSVHVARDITARKQAERALRELNEQLEQRIQERTVELRQSMDLVQTERQRFKDALDKLPAYLVLLAPDYTVPFANRFFEERFGKSGGKRCYEYLFQRTEPCENCESYKALKTNTPHHWEWTGPDGRNYDIYDFPFTDVDGLPLVMEVGLDITERKKAEAELDRHRLHLEELVKARTAELQARNEELARFNDLAVGRELRMIQLKKQVNDLCVQLGRPPLYNLEEQRESQQEQTEETES